MYSQTKTLKIREKKDVEEQKLITMDYQCTI
jgi:hypothetical protein